MDLSNLKPAEGSVKQRKRIGRGQGSGRGGTSTKGHKGQKARAGYSKKIGFEGGQMPLQRRVPKFGFTNINRVEYQPLNLDTLQILVDKLNIDTIDFNVLVENGLVGKRELVKLLGRGELKSKVSISVHKVSSTAKEAVEKLGGTVTLL